MKRERIVLASSSEARKRLLKRLGLEFEVRPAHLDEESVQKRIPDPRKLVAELSRLKARTVTADGAFVIGSDQVLVCDGKIYGKPHTSAKACGQLAKFSGKQIELLTGCCIRTPEGRERVFVHKTAMKFRKLGAREIGEYVHADQPLECAGSFKFESLGIGLFESVKTDDPTAIEGLPLLRVHKILRELGAV